MNILNLEPKGRIFAIGDIHGCRKELACLLAHLENHILKEEDTLIFTGDYIDRGPDSKGVVDDLMALKLRRPETYFLKGNHESMFLDAMGLGGTQGKMFGVNGGAETLKSYGLEDCIAYETCMFYGRVPKLAVNDLTLFRRMPEEHVFFYRKLNNIIVTEKYIFVHAGLDNYRDLANQTESVTMWIRDGWLDTNHMFNKVIVHGHTPRYQFVGFNRDPADNHLYSINIDTGCVFEGYLSCLELDDKDPDLMNVYTVKEGSRTILFNPPEELIYPPKGSRIELTDEDLDF